MNMNIVLGLGKGKAEGVIPTPYKEVPNCSEAILQIKIYRTATLYVHKSYAEEMAQKLEEQNIDIKPNYFEGIEDIEELKPNKSNLLKLFRDVGKVEELNKQLIEKEKSIADYEEMLENVVPKENIEHLQNVLSKVQVELEEKKKECEAVISSKAELESNLTALIEIKKGLQAELEATQSSIKEGKGIDEEQLQGLQEINKSYEKQIQELGTKNEELTKEINKYEKQLEHLVTENEDLTKEINKYEKQLEHLVTENEDLVTKIAEGNQGVTMLSDVDTEDKERLVEELEATKMKKAKVDAELEGVQKELTEIKEVLLKTEQSKAGIIEELEQSIVQISTIEDKLNKVEQEKVELANVVEEIKEKEGALQEEYSIVCKQIEVIQQEQAEQEQTNQAEKEKMQEELLLERAKVRTCQEQNQELKEELSKVQNSNIGVLGKYCQNPRILINSAYTEKEKAEIEENTQNMSVLACNTTESYHMVCNYIEKAIQENHEKILLIDFTDNMLLSMKLKLGGSITAFDVFDRGADIEKAALSKDNNVVLLPSTAYNELVLLQRDYKAMIQKVQDYTGGNYKVIYIFDNIDTSTTKFALSKLGSVMPVKLFCYIQTLADLISLVNNTQQMSIQNKSMWYIQEGNEVIESHKQFINALKKQYTQNNFYLTNKVIFEKKIQAKGIFAYL